MGEAMGATAYRKPLVEAVGAGGGFRRPMLIRTRLLVGTVRSAPSDGERSLMKNAAEVLGGGGAIASLRSGEGNARATKTRLVER
jgi:hypothetical protein